MGYRVATVGVHSLLLSLTRLWRMLTRGEEISAHRITQRAETFLNAFPRSGSFLVFLTPELGSDQSPGFAQLSVENGSIGVDHVLTSDLNRRTAAAFRQVVKREGLTLTQESSNGVDYLRVTTPDAARLVSRVLLEVFDIEQDARVGVIEEMAR